MRRPQSKKSATRLAILRRELGWMQKELADKCGFSTIYVLKLEHGERAMTHNAALALSFATGASVEWLKGKGRRYPIPTPSGQTWTPKAVEVNPIIWKQTKDGKRKGTLAPETINRYLDEDYSASEAQFANAMLAALCDGVAKLIWSAYAKKKTRLVIQLISEHLAALGKRFQVAQKWPNEKDGRHLLMPSLEAKMQASAQSFEKGLVIEFNRRGNEYRAYLERQARKVHQRSARKKPKAKRS